MLWRSGVRLSILLRPNRADGKKIAFMHSCIHAVGWRECWQNRFFGLSR